MDVKVKAPTFAKLFKDWSERVQKGGKTTGDALKAFEDAEADGLLEQEEEARPQQRARTRFSTSDPAEAGGTGATKAVSKTAIKEVLSKAVQTNPTRLHETPEFAGQGNEFAEKLKVYQDLNDGLAFCQAMMHRENEPFDVRSSKRWPLFVKLQREISSKILTPGGSGTGAEFVPTIMSSTMIELYRQKLRIAGLIEHIKIPQGTGSYDLPLEGADVDPYLSSGAADDDPSTAANVIGTRTPATAKVTFSPKGFKVRLLVNSEATEDAIFNLLDYLRKKGVQSLVEGTEGAIVNGDTTGTHMDADTTGATNYRKAYDGLRKLTNAEAKYALVTADAGKLKGLHFVNLRTKFGKFGDDPSQIVSVVSPIGAAHLTADSNFMTVDKIGDKASLLTGQVGMVLGGPVIVSSKVKNNLNNSGVNDGVTTDKTIAISFHRGCFALGDKREITVESMKDIQTDKWIVVVTNRHDFKRLQAEASLERNVGIITGISTVAAF
jgi:HK97 family phage major capsid protein